MRFPNLAWAIADRGLTNYKLAEAINISEARFSRCVSGRLQFTDQERSKISKTLKYSAGWLFAPPSPPAPLFAGSSR